MYKLYPYQERAVQAALSNPHRYCAFDMGMGKTLTMLEVIKRSNMKALIVAPMLVALRTWPTEIQKFTPELDYMVLHGRDKEQAYKSKARIKIINYDGLKWFHKMAEKHGTIDLKQRILILDESTMIKSPGSNRFKALKALRHFFKHTGTFCLSGEPMPNGYLDLWAQYFMLDYGAALETSFGRYKQKYFYESGPPRFICKLNSGAASVIKEKVKHLTSVLDAEDYLTMPEALYHDECFSLSNEVKEEIEQFKKSWLENVDVTNMSENSLLNKLRQYAQGAVYNEDRTSSTVVHEEKLKILESLLTNADSPVLCAINFKFELYMIRAWFNKNIPAITGDTTIAEKQKILADWDDRKIPLLLCHPAALSHGVNMQKGGSIIVWYCLPWSLEHYKQLNGRLIRPGQEKIVRVYHIIANNTMDETVASVLKRKDATQEDFKQAVKALTTLQ